MSSKYRVLICHNQYQHKGGEDTVVAEEQQLLLDRGHLVEMFSKSNHDLKSMTKFSALIELFWSNNSYAQIADKIKKFNPDVIHVHNTFPLISPSIYWAAYKHNIPIVQTLHNFRLLCPQAMFLRNGSICEDCLSFNPLLGGFRGCYRNSKLQSSSLASMLIFHRGIGTWTNKVTRYIALNEFCKNKFIAGGLPSDKLVIKSNFVDFQKPPALERNDFLFVGRLSHEKGISVLADAISKTKKLKINIVGDGPDSHLLDGNSQILKYGLLSIDHIRVKMASATALILPSIWYENFPRTIVEAFACELPVITSRLGALAELVEDGITGLLFNPGDANDLAEKIQWAADNPEKMRLMGIAARDKYEKNYTADINYHQLMDIYNDAIDEVKNRN